MRRVSTGDGDDTLGGYLGNELWGEGGNDLVSGDEGDDFVVGGAGDDELHGGNDTVNGDSGRDMLFGDFGDDFLRGRDGVISEVLDGGASAARGMCREALT